MLRDEFVEKIDAFGGIEKFTSALMEYKSTVRCVEKVIYNRLAAYFNHVYSFNVNVEAKAVKHKKLTQWVVDYLGAKLKQKEAEVIRLSLNLLQLKLEYVEGVILLY